MTLDIAHSAGTSWHDAAYDLSDVAALGRLDRIDYLCLIAHAGTGPPDPVDRSALEQLGYTVEQQYNTYRSTIYEYVRTPTPPSPAQTLSGNS